MAADDTTPNGDAQPTFELSASRQFNAWLVEQKLSLAFTTYQSGKLFLIGVRPDGKLSVFEHPTFCPGYARGLAFIGDFAVIGLSRPRGNRTFSGLALDDNLASRDAEARCGLLVIDLRSGDIVHWVRIGGVVEELYDVVTLPGVIRPMALGFKTDEIRRTISIDE